MRKPDLVRAIYAELRDHVAAEVSDGDVLRMAHLIVRSHTAEHDLLADFGKPGAADAFYRSPVDVAMNDGGWRVMEYETRNFGRRDDFDVARHRRVTNLIERYLGPEWQHHQWSGRLSPL